MVTAGGAVCAGGDRASGGAPGNGGAASGGQEERGLLLERLAAVLVEARNRKSQKLRERELCRFVGALHL